MTKQEQLKDQLKKIRGEMLVREAKHQSIVLLKDEFAKVSKEYKVFWLRDFKKKGNE